MTKNKFALQLFLAFSLIFLTHFLLNEQYHLISRSELLRSDGFVLSLVVVSFLLMRSEIDKKREQFIAKFMILTTLQMLAVMSMLLFVTYSGKENARILMINLVSFFVAVMAVQSLILIRSRK